MAVHGVVLAGLRRCLHAVGSRAGWQCHVGSCGGCSAALPTSFPPLLCLPPSLPPSQVAALAAEVRAAVAEGYLVRSRTDADTVEARAGYTARRDAIIAAGPQVRQAGASHGVPSLRAPAAKAAPHVANAIPGISQACTPPFSC